MPGQPDLNSGVIRPTLFLGLGGTGKEVLLRLRRKFYERWGVTGLPCTSYLWMDTDQRYSPYDEQGDGTLSAVTFRPDEMISLASGSEDLARVYRDREHWNHLHRWLPRELEPFAREIYEGAACIRAMGRLAYFLHFHRINEALEGALDSLHRADRIYQTREFFHQLHMGVPDIPEGGTQVVLVSSLAGGTGGGTFLDAAFHLRWLAQRGGRDRERIVGVLFMPNVFYPHAGTEVALRGFANAYAALKELEFYTARIPDAHEDPSVDFEVEWEPDRPRRVPGPPFSIPYILEMRNEDGLAIDVRNRTKLFNMVAESLFLDSVPGDFSTVRRCHSPGVACWMAGPAGANLAFNDSALPQAFARRYASFGMSKIEVPVDRLKWACARRLGYEIASYVNRDSGDPCVVDNVREDMVRRRFDLPGFVGRFGSEWKDVIRAQVAAAVPTSGVASLEKIDEIEKGLRDLEDRLIYAGGADWTRWGKAVHAIRQKGREVAQMACEDMLQWLKDCLENDARGLKSLIGGQGYLQCMAKCLQELYTPDKPGGLSVLDRHIASAESAAKYYGVRMQATRYELREALFCRRLAWLWRREWVVDRTPAASARCRGAILPGGCGTVRIGGGQAGRRSGS